MQLIAENPGLNRSQLKEKGKGLHTYICKYDWDWYDNVTPIGELGKKKIGTIDWKQRDEEYLRLSKEAVGIILQREGKPSRVTPLSIRRRLGMGVWFDNKKLVQTREYILKAKENIKDFRAPYKIQLYAGFGGDNKEIKGLVIQILEEYK